MNRAWAFATVGCALAVGFGGWLAGRLGSNQNLADESAGAAYEEVAAAAAPPAAGPVAPALSASPEQAKLAPDEGPTIDIPADPPPSSESDRVKSGLPTTLFEARERLQMQGPTPERLAAVAARLRNEVSKETAARATESFRKHDEAAALAIGRFRLGTLTAAEATAIVARAQADYRREVTTALGISSRDFAAIFESD